MTARTCTVDLTLDLTAPHAARTLVCLLLRQWGVTDEDARDSAAIVVTELVTNSLVHCDDGGPVRLDVSLGDAGLELSVSDTGIDLPQQRRASRTDESGRGLSIIEQLSTSWGVEQVPGGKRVYAHLPLERCA